MAEKSAWDTESGLIDDVDGWIVNPKFGLKDEYAQAVQATAPGGGLMFICDIADEKGEVIGNQGWSVGSGWETSPDACFITHGKRTNVVGSSLYGQLIRQVVDKLGVDMDPFGVPTDAMSWNGLGFHWNQLPHTTVSGDEKTGLMPTAFLGKGQAAATAPTSTAPSSTLEKELAVLAKKLELKDFQREAVRMPAVINNDDLMAKVLDGGPDGFWEKNRS